MKKLFFALCLLMAGLSAMAQDNQTVFNFLRIPTSAHATALGGENISVIEDDASLALSNPALLSSVSSKTISIGYMNYLKGAGAYTAGYTHVITDKLTVGGAANYVNYGSMKETNINGEELGTFNPSDLALEGILSYTLAKNLVGGIAAKFVYSKIGNYSSTAAAVDLGLNYYSADKDFSASIVARNLGGQLTAYDDEYEKLPIDLLVGATKGLGFLPVQISATISDMTRWDYSFWQHLGFGADIYFMQQFYVAVGYNLRRAATMKVKNSEGEETSGSAGFSVGAGLILERFKFNFCYAKHHVCTSSLLFNASFTL